MEHNKYGIGNVFSIDDKNKMNKDHSKVETKQNDIVILDKKMNKNTNNLQVQNLDKDLKNSSKKTEKDKKIFLGNQVFGARSIVAIILVFVISIFAVGSVVAPVLEFARVRSPTKPL